MTAKPPLATLLFRPDTRFDWDHWSELDEVWVCYYCEAQLTFPGDEAWLPPRLVLKCADCSMFQVVGVDEQIRRDASLSKVELPPGIVPETLEKIRVAREALIARYGKATLESIADAAKCARSTVQIYLPYLKRDKHF